MNLLIIRHAIAMDRSEFQTQAKRLARAAGTIHSIAEETDDDYRPLTDVGTKKMRKVAKGLLRHFGKLDLLVTSPLIRAMQTAEILRDAWGELDMATSDDLSPGSDPASFCRWLREQPQMDSVHSLVAIVGHEPHLSLLAGWLLTGVAKPIFELKKGGACLLHFEKGFEKGKARLCWLATPTMLRKLKAKRI